MSKGDHYRPIENREAFEKNFERIFGKPSKEDIEAAFADDHFEYTPNPKPVVEGEDSDN